MNLASILAATDTSGALSILLLVLVVIAIICGIVFLVRR